MLDDCIFLWMAVVTWNSAARIDCLYYDFSHVKLKRNLELM